jgi:hypothetical protein
LSLDIRSTLKSGAMAALEGAPAFGVWLESQVAAASAIEVSVAKASARVRLRLLNRFMRVTVSGC